MPVTVDVHTLPGPETIAVRQLSNGLTLLARENFASPAVFVAGYIQAGSQDESPDQAGLASLVASLVTRGTRSFTYEEINERIESVGASLRVSGGTHTTTFTVKSLAEDIFPLLELLAEMLQAPTFPEEHVNRVKRQRLTALREREHNTQAMARLAFYEHAYPPDHPYHYPTSGHVHTVEPLTRDDLVRFFETHYEPRGGAIVLVGAMPAEDALNLLERVFGAWENRPGRERRPLPPVSAPAAPVEVFKPIPEKSQSDIVLGAPAMPVHHPDYVSAVVANSILGVFGLMGRLGESVRDEEGLAYYAHSVLQRAPSNAPWYILAGVAPDRVQHAVGLIKNELRRLGEEPVPSDELDDNKSFIVGSLPLRLETNEGVAMAILDMVRYDLGLDYLQRFPHRVLEVTAEDVCRVTATYLRPETCVLAVAGPPAE